VPRRPRADEATAPAVVETPAEAPAETAEAAEPEAVES
jgi:hypothetical protein